MVMRNKLAIPPASPITGAGVNIVPVMVLPNNVRATVTTNASFHPYSINVVNTIAFEKPTLNHGKGLGTMVSSA